MAKKDKVYMPSGMGGIVRYGEEGKSEIKLKPKQVLMFAGALVVFELLLRLIF